MIFIDRADAGRQLAKKLSGYTNAVVYALPRGGLPVGAEIAEKLKAPLDLLLVRKIGHPNWEEYAVGAVAENNEPVWNKRERPLLDNDWVNKKLEELHAENRRRRRKYFPTGYKQPSVKNKTAILVDDGIATGLTVMAAVKGIISRQPSEVIVAAPVAPADSIANLMKVADKIIVVDNPDNFMGAVGAHYQKFPQLDDIAVINILKTAAQSIL